MKTVFENETCKVLLYKGSIASLGPFDHAPPSNQQKIARKYKYIKFKEDSGTTIISDVLVHYNCDAEIKEGTDCDLYIYAHNSEDPIHTVIAITTDTSTNNDLQNFTDGQQLLKTQITLIARGIKAQGWFMIFIGFIATILIITAPGGIPLIFFGWYSFIRKGNKMNEVLQSRLDGFPKTKEFELIISKHSHTNTYSIA